MTQSTRFRDQLFTGLVVALLLLMSGLNGATTVALAALLFLVGLLLFPEMRRTAIIAAAIAGSVAVAIVFARALL